MQINSYFDKIYLLNLFRRKDRLEKSINKLNSVQLNYSVFNGTDGTVLNHIWSKLSNPYFTNPNYLGCAISHLSIYRDAIENSYQKILIIEDDNLVNKNIQSLFDSIEIPDWSDLLYLGYIPLSEDCSMWTYGESGIQGHNMINNNVFRPSNLWGLYSYGIGISLMREMVDLYNSEFPMEIDRYFVRNIQKRGSSLALAPQLFCCDDNVYSDNLGYSPSLLTRSIDSRFSNPSDYI
jgi:hypothetical protein